MSLSDVIFSPGALFRPRQRSPTEPRQNVLTVDSPGVVFGEPGGSPGRDSAQRLSAVYAAVDIRSDDMSCLPAYVMDTNTRKRITDHPILQLLSVRPNPLMTPSVRKKILERSVLLCGNAYDWIIRDPVSAMPTELIPIPGNLVRVWVDSNRRAWYDVTDPVTGEVFRLPQEDVCHYKGPTNDGIHGLSVLSYAAQCIQAGLAAQDYNRTFYESGGQPSGVLTVDADLGGYVKDKDGRNTDKTLKDSVREEWERVHGGAANAHKVAVLDHGMKYQALTISHKDAMFIEQQTATIEDIARYFGMPLYKLQSGKQSYNSNEQNAIEYMGRLQPRVTQNEEEQTWKLLSLSDQRSGLEIRYNMMALLRSDQQSRANYYEKMWRIGAYSVNRVLEFEDLPDVEGGDEHMASLNYVPLRMWARLSANRNGGNSNES